MGQPVPEEVTALVNQTHESVIEEISNSLEFYLSASQGNPVSQCFVTGGGSKTAGLLAAMARVVKVPCEVFDPFMNIKFNEKILTPQYLGEVREFASVAMGLGLRAVGDS